MLHHHLGGGGGGLNDKPNVSGYLGGNDRERTATENKETEWAEERLPKSVSHLHPLLWADDVPRTT